MEILKILIPVLFGLFPVGIALRMQLPQRKKKKEILEKLKTFECVRGTVRNIEKKSNVSGNAKAQNLFIISYAFTAKDGETYEDTYKLLAKDELNLKEVFVHYDPKDPKQNLIEQEMMECEKRMKESYTILYCGLFTMICLLLYLNIL